MFGAILTYWQFASSITKSTTLLELYQLDSYYYKKSSKLIGSSIRGKEIYSGKEKKPVLALLSKLYPKLDAISVSISRLSSCFTLHYLLTT